MDFGDIAALLSGDLVALAAIGSLWAFAAKDGASTRTRVSVLGLIGVIIFVVGVAAWPRSGHEGAGATGQIVSPASGDSVGRDIEVRGVLAGIPESQHVWLVVRDGNRLYPQDTEVTPREGEWSLSFHQGGMARSISLELYRMGDEGNRFIDRRLNAGSFSGITRIPGAVRLDLVENLRLPAAPARPSGQIVSPASGDSVRRDIEVRGVLAGIPQSQHVWVAVRDGGLLYPQGSEVSPREGQWSLSFHQAGVTRSISLELYRMGDRGNRFIDRRLAARDFSGITRIPGAVRLDVVENLRIRG